MNKNFKIDNAIILAAGFASRFAPLSLELPKALLNVCGEILIERQIHQLQEAGIQDIIVVTGYKHEAFAYLKDKFGIRTILNNEYSTRNNHSSIWAARDYINNSYICSADNYFTENVFSSEADVPYYAAVYEPGYTDEYCLSTDKDNRITDVKIGGYNSWYMLGHVLWDTDFSKRFLAILEREYHLPATHNKLWEQLYLEHLDELNLYIKKYNSQIIHEFDSLDELCLFDSSYIPYRDSLISKKSFN